MCGGDWWLAGVGWLVGGLGLVLGVSVGWVGGFGLQMAGDPRCGT